MTDRFNLPLLDDTRTVSSASIMQATDAHMRRPVESDPCLHQLLPRTTHVEPPYTLAGVHADTSTTPHRHEHYAADSRHAVTALYTPDGTCAYQKRILACRVTRLDDDHPYSDDIDEYHDQILDDATEDDDEAAHTDWIDSTFTQDEVNGHTRTVLSVRKPILVARTSANQDATRPVLVTALAIQTTPWGVIETGAYQCPDPDPGDARDTVTTLADTLTHRIDRLSRPTPDDQWPLFYGHDLSQAELATAMQETIAELTAEQREQKDEPGAVLTTLLDRFQADYDVAEREALKLLDLLEQQGRINDSNAGLITLT